ncbi:6-hydroxy-D-nicotine oxidase [Trichophyton mentagrophytes]|nr:6-hydroxy-D-nicotine oxidase [Trichophyton mentagrophytes]
MAQMDDNCVKEELLSRLSASSAVVVQADAGWDKALRRWTGYRAQTPAAVVHPANENDVVETISYAVESQRPFVVRGGGHSNGFSTISSPGIILDLSQMRNVSVDTERKVAIAQGGATMGDGIRAAASEGLAIATGTCNEVGLVGAALGGGIGRFLGHYGYAADTVVSMRVAVVGSRGRAQIVEASRETNPDLFWALRGSGHLFGVVIEATFRVFPGSTRPGIAALFSGRGRLVFCAPNEKPIVLLQLWYLGNPEEAAEKFEPLLGLPFMADHPLHSIGRLIPYMNLNDSSERICAYAGRKNLAAFGMGSISEASCMAALKVYMDFIAQYPGARRTHILTEFYSMDVAGELDQSGEETSIPGKMRREVKYWVMPLAWYDDAALDEACAGLNQAIRDAFLTSTEGIAYINMPFEREPASNIFGDKQHLEKLRSLKQKWDPLGIIRGIVDFC